MTEKIKRPEDGISDEDNARFRDFAEAASDWFFEMDADLRFTYVSERHHEFLGVSPDKVIGKTRWDAHASRRLPEEEDQWQAHIAALKAHESWKDFTYTIIRDDGYRLWGNETCSSEPLNKFLPVVRTHDIIMDSVAKAHRWARDKPFSVQLIHDIAETVNGFLRQMKARGWTIGYEVWIDPALNTRETWLNGDLFVSYDSEAPAPLQRLIFQFNRNTNYYEELAADAIARASSLS